MQTLELSKYMFRKDILLSRLSEFSDKPEHYQMWKNAFTSVTKEMEMSPAEEIDLLVKWLGPDSSRQVNSLRAAYSANPNIGLKHIWQRLEDRYAAPELIDASLKKKVANFTKIGPKENIRLYELADITSEIAAFMEDPKFSQLLSYMNTSVGIAPIVRKLPFRLQGKWTNEAINIKKRSGVPYPPFRAFSQFLNDLARNMNDPSFCYDNTEVHTETRRVNVSARKTNMATDSYSCILHPHSKHNTNTCYTFRKKPLKERKNILFAKGVCFKCCSAKHKAKDCTQSNQCEVCRSPKHSTALHEEYPTHEERRKDGVSQSYGGEIIPKVEVNSKCTELCSQTFKGKSCAKIVLVKIHNKKDPSRKMTSYALIDDQSNRTLVSSKILNFFDENGPEIEYSMASCAGGAIKRGRCASDYIVESYDEECMLNLPTMIECDDIPNERSEIPTPDIGKNYPHLEEACKHLYPLQKNAEILLLIGRDLPEAHHVHTQFIGNTSTPFAQKLALGWVVVGELCLGSGHISQNISVKKTHILQNGRPSILEPCTQNISVKTVPAVDSKIGMDVFQKGKYDDKIGMSVEDKYFLQLMETEMYRNQEGNWTAPLPFRQHIIGQEIKSNRNDVYKRTVKLTRNLKNDSKKLQHFLQFMEKMFKNGHAETVPDITPGQSWYLPLFGVYHPKKRDKIRVVFDSSASYNGHSLNDMLVTGPDLTNNLLGILLRFRIRKIAIIADIEQMFYCFKVSDNHRDFLRFLWFKNNDPCEEIVEYRMSVHVFGNSPSPAIATLGLRKAAKVSADEYGEDVLKFVSDNFYLDDGLISLDTPEEAVSLLKRTQEALKAGGNLRLHKIASNSKEVLQTFSKEDLAESIVDLMQGSEELPTQHTLGVAWNINRDCFTFKISKEVKPCTRRGILSTVNSIYDPLGLAAPVTVRGRLFLKQLVNGKDWDESLTPKEEGQWLKWRDSLHHLEDVYVARHYVSMCNPIMKEVHIFCDASKEAIAAVAYMKSIDKNNVASVSFIMGKSKIAPKHGHTVPRLELCAAVLAVELGRIIDDQLKVDLKEMHFYSDSKVVLGYIQNERRRFYVYVENRIDKIRSVTKPCQWRYVETTQNPADEATRPFPVSRLQNSIWLNGSSFLGEAVLCSKELYQLVSPEEDTEIRPLVTTMKQTLIPEKSLDIAKFERFSTWRSLVRAFTTIKSTLRKRHQVPDLPVGRDEVEIFIIKEVQRATFRDDIEKLEKDENLKKTSPILALNPFLDEDGILRVGGRIRKSDLGHYEKMPVIIPKKSHVAVLLVRHFHEKTYHQGRHFTEGEIRRNGYWIIGMKKLIASILRVCVTCRKLRSQTSEQKMADLPEDRLKPCPPFTNVGVDMFGPFLVVTRKTRGGMANNKRWAALFTCLTSRAIHIEVVEEMTSSSFINALRRFVAIRGPVNEVRSDRGTNFIAASKELKCEIIDVEDPIMKGYLDVQNIVWRFNPPHSSHMGGVWERMIGIARRILNSMLSENKHRNLTHEVLCTFMYEVTAIINSRPLVPVSTDPEQPLVLSPSVLLTQKTNMWDKDFKCIDLSDSYKTQWKFVQMLAEKFWDRWKKEYLLTLQTRRKWPMEKRNLKVNDIVLLKDTCDRISWPMGIISKIFPSDDDIVRKVEVRIFRDGSVHHYNRPVTEVVPLILEDQV